MIFWLSEIGRWIILVIAFFVSVYYWKGYKHSAQRYFPLLLLFTIVIESIATIKSHYYKEASNALYNFYLIVSFVFYLTWFISILRRKIIPKILLSILLCVVVYAVLTGNATKNLYFSLIVTGSVLILIGAFLFFKELLEEEEVVNFLRNQQFWIMSGLLIFYIGFLPVYLLIENLDLTDYRIGLVIPFLNILLYGCFIIGFRCRNK